MFYANEELQRWLFSLLIPEDILVSFEIDNIKEREEAIEIEIVEKGLTPDSINWQTSCPKWVHEFGRVTKLSDPIQQAVESTTTFDNFEKSVELKSASAEHSEKLVGTRIALMYYMHIWKK